MANPNKPQDEVERYLAGESELSQLYRAAPPEQPSAQFEQAILSAARAAAAQRGQANASVWSRFWRWIDQARVPVATMASIVLVVGVAIGAYRQYGMNPPVDFEAPAPVVVPAASAPALADADQRADTKPQAKSAAPKVAFEKSMKEMPPPSKVDVTAVVAPAPAKREDSKDMLGKSIAPAPAAVPLAEEAVAPMRLKAAPPPAAAKRIAHPAADTLQANESVQGIVQGEKEKKDARSAVGDSLQPEAWLKKIERMIEQGKLNEARRELKAFKQTYPAFVLPDRVRKLDSQ